MTQGCEIRCVFYAAYHCTMFMSGKLVMFLQQDEVLEEEDRLAEEGKEEKTKEVSELLMWGSKGGIVHT